MLRIDQDWCSLVWGTGQARCAGWDTDYQASSGLKPAASDPAWTLTGVDHETVAGGILAIENCGTDTCVHVLNHAAPTGSVYGKAVVRCAAGAPAGWHVEAILVGNSTHYVEALISDGAITTKGTAYACTTTAWRTIKVRLDIGGAFELFIDGVSVGTGTGNVGAYSAARFGKIGVASVNHKYEWQSVQVRHGVDPDALASLGALPCYNTPGTCQNAAAYIGTTKTYRFCDTDGPQPAPGQFTVYPALKSLEVYGTSIDLKLGLGARQKLSADVGDFGDQDYDTDPYRSFRTNHPTSTFWRKWLARNPYHEGRGCCQEWAEIDENGLIDMSAVTRLWFVIDTITDPTGGEDSSVTIEAKDRLVMLDKAVVPVATNGTLAGALATGATNGAMAAGMAAQYGTPPFYFKVDDEIIQVTAVSGDTLTTIVRGTWGTTDADHDDGAKCQLCFPLENVSINTAWSSLLTAAGVGASNVDSAGAAADVAIWQSGFLVKSIITEPTLVGDVIAKLCEQWGIMTWDEAETSLIKMRSLHPPSVGGTVAQINDVETTARGGFRSEPMREDRCTTVAIWYGVKDWSKDLEDGGNYSGVQIAHDALAASAPQNRHATTVTIWGWMIPATMGAQVASMALRRLKRFRDVPRKFKHEVTEDDGAAMRAGDLVQLTTDEVVDADGNPKPSNVWLLSKVRKADSMFVYDLTMQTDYSVATNVCAFYAPDGHPDWSLATESQRAYGYYAHADGTVGGGVGGGGSVQRLMM
jgi:hypothetical protein